MRLGFTILGIALAAWAAPSTANDDPCLGLTAAEAAGLLGVPAEGLKAQRSRLPQGLWQCSFAGADAAQSLAYSVEHASDTQTAQRELARYRHNLEVAGEAPPYRGKLPRGAYSEIADVGDESVWTDVNGSFTFRRGAVTVQVQSPADKLVKIKAGQLLASKLR